MKIVVTAEGNAVESGVDPRFGRCQYFYVYDTESKEGSFVVNEAARSNQGAGVSAAQAVIDMKAEKVVTGNAGMNAVTVLKAAGVDMYQAGTMSVSEAVASLEKGDLKQILKPTR